MKYYFILISIILSAFVAPATVTAQSRDFLTEDEVEIIRDAQQIDQRIMVLTHAIDRRLGVLKVNVGTSAKTEAKEWGPLPEGTRTQLLSDIKKILQKAIDDVDNLSERPDSMVVQPDEDTKKNNKKKPQGFAELFPIAVRHLAAAADRFRPIFKSELDKTKDEADKGPILDSLDMCDQITAAVAKLPPEVRVVKDNKKTKH